MINLADSQVNGTVHEPPASAGRSAARRALCPRPQEALRSGDSGRICTTLVRRRTPLLAACGWPGGRGPGCGGRVPLMMLERNGWVSGLRHGVTDWRYAFHQFPERVQSRQVLDLVERAVGEGGEWG